MAANQTSFKRGFDPRRAVHQGKGIQVFRDTLAEHMRNLSLDAVAYVQSVLNDPTQHPKLRMIAAQEIMNRSWGLPVNTMVIKDLDSGAGKLARDMSNEELHAAVMNDPASRAEYLRMVEEEPLVIDITPDKVASTTSPDAETATKASLKQAGISE